MPSSRTVRALVFSRKNIGEADRLVTFFSREDGLIRAVAKGVRKIPSARGGHLEPFTCVDAVLHESKSGMYAGNIETEEYFHALREDNDAFARACEIVRLFNRFFDVHQPAEELYDALMNTWKLMPTLSFEKRVVVNAALELLLLKHAGVLPEFSAWAHRVERKYLATLQYLVKRPEDAERIALSQEDAHAIERIMKMIIARTTADAGVVYS